MSKRLSILAFDLGTKTGWAFACWSDEGTASVESGCEDFSLQRGQSPGFRYIKFRAWLGRMIEYCAPGLIAYEQTHQRGGAATEVSANFAGRVQEVCAEHGIEHVAVHSGTLKKFATGRGVASKEQMVAAASRLWGKPLDPECDQDEADALAVLAWAARETAE